MSVLKKTTLAVLGSALVVTSAGFVAAESRGDRDGKPRFETMDVNKDGKVDFTEFQTSMNKRFNDFDVDQNGIITKAEIEEKADGRRAQRIAKRIAHRFDMDGNNEITKEELENRQTKIFALLDRNDDGFVVEDEMPKRGGKKRNEKRD